jgi:hypothetical protein
MVGAALGDARNTIKPTGILQHASSLWVKLIAQYKTPQQNNFH